MLLQLAGEMDGHSASSFQEDTILDKGIYAGHMQKSFITIHSDTATTCLYQDYDVFI